MSNRSLIEFMCEDCKETTWFPRIQTIRASGIKCPFCGSRNMIDFQEMLQAIADKPVPPLPPSPAPASTRFSKWQRITSRKKK